MFRRQSIGPQRLPKSGCRLRLRKSGSHISTWVSFAPGGVQRIRLPSEVLEQRSGNCIELALLYAAAAEAMDMEAAIIGIPEHAYVGVRTDPDCAIIYYQ
jgi:hypothetical protein